jgi:MoxR-like ATPase
MEEERAILDLALSERMAVKARAEEPHLTAEVVARARREVAGVFLSEAVRDYIVRLVAATRGDGGGGTAAKNIIQPASPRGSICLAMAGKAAAWLDGRDYVTPADIREAAGDVLSGRIGLAYRARAEGRTARQVVAEILDATPVV